MLSEYLNYLIEQGLKPRTVDAYCSDLSRYLRFLDGLGKTLGAVTGEDVQKFLDVMQDEKLTLNSRNRKISAVRGFHRWLMERGYVEQDPALGIHLPRPVRHPPKVLTEPEIQALLKAPDKSLRGMRDRAMFQLLYATGLRVGELVGLSLGSIQMDVMCINVTGSKLRAIPFGEPTREALVQYLNIRSLWARGNNQQVFLTDRGAGMTRQGFWKLLNRWASVAGITRPISPHKVRHTFALHQIATGANFKQVKELLGHADIATTYLYNQVRARGGR